MTISATYIGQSTVQVSTSFTVASGAASLTQFMQFAATVADAIVGTQPGAAGVNSTALGAGMGVTFVGSGAQASSGWTLYDAFWGGINTDAGATSPEYTQVFRSLNKDGVTYKNIILRYDTKQGTINTSTCEYWDTLANYNNANTTPTTILASNHAATNEAWTYFDSAPIGFNTTTTDLIIMVSPRWCILHSYLNNEPSNWAGVVETAREDIMDTAVAGLPCWGWVSSTLWLLGAASISGRPLATSEHTLICMPRTRQGYTSINAAKGWAADYGATFFPNWINAASVGAFAYYLGNQQNKFISNAWDSTRRLTLPIKPISDYATTIANYGQIFGMKVISPVGVNMNKITIPVNADGDAAVGGTDRSHWLLNLHHKTYSTDTTSWWTNGSWTNEIIATGGRPEKVISTGAAYYVIITGGTKVTRINATTKAVTDIIIGGGYTDIKYDGERYIYVTSSTASIALTRIDTADDTTIVTANSSSISGAAVFSASGYSALAINGNTVCCAFNVASNTPNLHRYVRQASSGTVSALALTGTFNTITIPSLPAAETQIIRDMTADHEGNFWCAPFSTAIANFRLAKVSNTGTPSLINPITFATQFNNIMLQVLDGNNILVHAPVSSGAHQVGQFNPRTGLIVGSVQTVSTLQALNTNTDMSSIKFGGAIMTVPRNSTVANTFVVNSLGKTITTAIGAPVIHSDQGTAQTLATANGFIATDSARIFLTTETGVKIFSNANGGTIAGGNPATSMTLGQVAIPV